MSYICYKFMLFFLGLDNYLRSKPQLSGQIILQHIFRELDSKVPVGPFVSNHGIHNGVRYRQNLVLSLSQLVHQRRASFGVFSSVKTVQFVGDYVQVLVGVEELG